MLIEYAGVEDGLDALIDEPLQTWNLSQRADCGKNQRQFCDNQSHSENTNHGSGNKSCNHAQSRHNSSQKTDSDNPLKQGCSINPLQSVNNAGKECHEHVDGRLNKTGQITGNSFKHPDEELEQGIYNLRSILDQRLKNTSDKL